MEVEKIETKKGEKLHHRGQRAGMIVRNGSDDRLVKMGFVFQHNFISNIYKHKKCQQKQQDCKNNAQREL